MKEELELKHIYGYLMYGLYALIDGVICEIEGVDFHVIHTVIAERVNYKLSEIKPILRPLSDLLKEIEINGNKFVPIEKLLKERDCDAEYDFIEAIEDDWASADSKFEFAPYSIMKKLFEWNFDVFGLIEKGLAIDINTLKE